MLVSDFMTRNFVRLQPEDSVRSAFAKFLQYRLDIGCVLHADDLLDGIVTKYNLYRMLVNGCSLEEPIGPAMIRDVVTVPQHIPMQQARDILITSQVAHAVVLDQRQKVVGIMAKADLIQAFLMESERLNNQVTALIEHLEDAVVAIDNQHKIITYNSAAERLFQQRPEHVLGGPVETLLPQIGEDITSALQNRFPLDAKKIFLPTAIALATYAPVTFRQQVIGAIAVLKDLTAYEKVAKELETTKKLERTLESALEIAYDGIAIIGEEGRITMVNDALLELYQIKRHDLLDRVAEDKLPELGLSETLRTDQERTSDIQEIKGRKCLITRTPIIRDGKRVGAIAKVMFRQLDHLKDLFLRLEDLENELTYYRSEYIRASTQGTALDYIITRNPVMESLKKQTYLAAQSFSTILITGESGTGKELFAQAVHEISGRPGKFVKVNCAAIPSELLESEFFGYADGAFTGAKKGGKPGKFELADGGTLFLDEIGDMPLSLQAKLLRVLQERSFERVGDVHTRHVNVRIVAATNKRLEELIEQGKFREDLYYRINVIHLTVPPLCERLEDLPVLCDHLVRKLNRILDKEVIGVRPAALELMRNYRWPGNVRELENVLERAMNLESSNWIEAHHLPQNLLSVNTGNPPASFLPLDRFRALPANAANKRDIIAAAEKDLILRVLQECGGNRTHAAKHLGISRSTLYQKMRMYHITEKSLFQAE
ncbi:sigma 54-interacting transcriptional regulator [Effusibacillus dendaii]|uniref:Sigma-54-dependent Fis family transcriptional regulator n=1 Tax=Effusibacillus dendaii TaxID=2743772 RepID=A0A7I8D9T6_9BACL|nr:sigma 54-interacting transcriptional regulator [Effusibacillus dendaii]BCJ86122.1 sigma-54-dependent Fis family transcriptional regulator [Effusibacillus dendaii]